MWKNEGGPSIKTNIWKIGILLYSLTDLHIFYIYIFSKEIGKFPVSCPFSEKWRGYSVCTLYTNSKSNIISIFHWWSNRKFLEIPNSKNALSKTKNCKASIYSVVHFNTGLPTESSSLKLHSLWVTLYCIMGLVLLKTSPIPY